MFALILTQPALRSEPWVDALSEAGIGAVRWPMSELNAAPQLDIARLVETLRDCRWVLFPSPSAIAIVLNAWRQIGAAWPQGLGVGLIGPGSLAEFELWQERVPGLSVARVVTPLAPPFDAHALLARIEFQHLEGVAIAVLRRADGREEWLETLRARGAALQAITVYRMHPLDPPAGARAWLIDHLSRGQALAVSVASAQAGERLMGCVTGWVLPEPIRRAFIDSPVLTQHPRIAAELKRFGWTNIREHAPGLAPLVRTVESLR